MTFKVKSELNFDPSRNLGYSVFFYSSEDQTLCECCVSETEFDHDTTFIEVPNPENFALQCDKCNHLIDCDVIPSDLEEAVNRLVRWFGWDNESATTFSTYYFEREYNEKDYSC